MLNNLFSKLRKKMTVTYALVFASISFLIVVATFVLVWWSILSIDKDAFHAKIIHEGEEWITSKELPVSETELSNGEVLAYFEKMDGKTVIVDQLGQKAVGKTLADNRKAWPTIDEKTKLLQLTDGAGQKYRYLAGVAVVQDGNKNIGKLYMFKNYQIYFEVAKQSLYTLTLLMLVLFGLGGLGSYYLAGKNIKPISNMYDQQKQFTADASHEMRTPLAVIKLACESVNTDEESKLSENSKETLGMMEEEIDRLTRLTENLMTLARSDNNQLQLNFVKFDFSQMAARIVQQMQLIADKKKINITSAVKPNLLCHGEENSINRLLIILLDNAIKYSSAGTNITLSLERSGNNALLKVLDQGEGIREEEKTKVFDRFYRVDKARSRKMGGLGLGLSLAKAIVEAHSGKIWITDNPKQQGTCFNALLPLNKR